MGQGWHGPMSMQGERLPGGGRLLNRLLRGSRAIHYAGISSVNAAKQQFA